MLINIDFNRLEKVYTKSIALVAIDEVFYAVPNAKDYALSNYARLYRRHIDASSKQHWKKCTTKYNQQYRSDAYTILFDDGQEKDVTVFWLIKWVFKLPRDMYLTQKYFYRGRYPFALDNLFLFSRADFISHLQAKCEGKIDRNHPDNELELKTGISDLHRFLYNTYEGMMRRGANKSYKKHNPQYKDVRICAEWYRKPDVAKDYLLEKLYYYPDSRLVADKDLMTFGLGQEYSPGKVIFLPENLNSIFRRGNRYRVNKTKNGLFNVPGFGDYQSFEEALQAAREVKAMYLESLANTEELKGYLPDEIISQIREWAKRCRAGKIAIWEPKTEVAV